MLFKQQARRCAILPVAPPTSITITNHQFEPFIQMPAPRGLAFRVLAVQFRGPAMRDAR